MHIFSHTKICIYAYKYTLTHTNPTYMFDSVYRYSNLNGRHDDSQFAYEKFGVGAFVQFLAVCCSVLQCIAACCSDSHFAYDNGE